MKYSQRNFSTMLICTFFFAFITLSVNAYLHNQIFISIWNRMINELRCILMLLMNKIQFKH